MTLLFCNFQLLFNTDIASWTFCTWQVNIITFHLFAFHTFWTSFHTFFISQSWTQFINYNLTIISYTRHAAIGRSILQIHCPMWQATRLVIYLCTITCNFTWIYVRVLRTWQSLNRWIIRRILSLIHRKGTRSELNFPNAPCLDNKIWSSICFLTYSQDLSDSPIGGLG